MPGHGDYWFPAKRYGWGWGPPVVWQGWVVMLVWTVVLLGGLFLLLLRQDQHRIATALVFVLLMSAALTLVCYWKGEPPKWRWGDSSK